MKRRILSASVWLVTFTVLVLALVAGAAIQEKTEREIQSTMRGLVAAVAAYLPEIEDHQTAAQNLSEQLGYRVTIAAADGTRLGDSDLMAGGGNLLEREEFVQAALSGAGFATSGGPIFGPRSVYAVARTPHGYFIRLSRTTGNLFSGLFSMLPGLLVGSLIVGGLAVLVARKLAESIVRPIGEFSTSLDRVMEGGARLDPDGYPYEELQGMAFSINHLSDEVDTSLLRIEQENRKLDTILDSMKEGLVLLDADEEVLLINDTACRIFGFVRGTGYDSLVYMTRDIGLLDAVAEVKKTGSVRQVEYSAPGGGNYEVTIGPTEQDPETGMSGTVMILSDIGVHHSTTKIRQEFFASASHELKTPITSVRGFTELLLAGGEALSEEIREEYLGRILHEAQRMQGLIEDILMITRMESGELRYEREELDLRAVLEGCCADIEPLALEEDITIMTDIEPCHIYASRKELEELFGNLLSNAVKYNRPEGRIEVRLWIEDGGPLIRVFNTGEAIPETSKERIFERFYRIDKGRSKAVGGTGLGLAIVKHIVGRYGAKITLIPRPGLGNTFEVMFPPSLTVVH